MLTKVNCNRSMSFISILWLHPVQYPWAPLLTAIVLSHYISQQESSIKDPSVTRKWEFHRTWGRRERYCELLITREKFSFRQKYEHNVILIITSECNVMYARHCGVETESLLSTQQSRARSPHSWSMSSQHREDLDSYWFVVVILVIGNGLGSWRAGHMSPLNWSYGLSLLSEDKCTWG